MCSFCSQSAYRTTRRQTNSRSSSRGLDNSRTGQLADNEWKKHGITILYLHIKPNPNPYSNPIYWISNRSGCSPRYYIKAHSGPTVLYTANYKSNISASWLVRELTSPQLDWRRLVEFFYWCGSDKIFHCINYDADPLFYSVVDTLTV